MTTPTETPPSQPIRLTGPTGIVAAVPQMLGFEPDESVAVLCLEQPRGRVGPVCRIDTAEIRHPGAVEQLLAVAERYADTVAVVCYHAGPRPAELDSLLRAFDAAGTPVAGVWSVTGGMIRASDDADSYLADGGTPVAGDDDPEVSSLRAASALGGRRILPDRAALVASVAGPTRQRARRMEATIQRLARQLPPPSADAAGVADAVARTRRMWARARRECERTGEVSTRTALTLALLTDRTECRDRLIGALVRDGRHALAPLISVVGRCPDAHVAQIASVLAVIAYRCGDGALAQCALDRVTATDPHHRLARLLAAAMAGGLPPESLTSMATDDRDDPWV